MDNNSNSNDNSFLTNNPALNGMDLPKLRPVGQKNSSEENTSFLTNNPVLNTMDLPQMEPVGQDTDDNSIGGRHR